ncbi:hypothetical protein AcV7_005002 [Taiwanofungus camphoratus]|nr:hypothetical protein AcV7_005002 [Antrodia cinnamomea]
MPTRDPPIAIRSSGAPPRASPPTRTSSSSKLTSDSWAKGSSFRSAPCNPSRRGRRRTDDMRTSRHSEKLDSGRIYLGFAAVSLQRYNPGVDVLLSESDNKTLNSDETNAGSGAAHMDKWLSIFALPIAKRLKKSAPGAGLRNADVFNLLAMCPFESLAAERASAFCRPFTEDDFCAFEYHGDLERYYKTG